MNSSSRSIRIKLYGPYEPRPFFLFQFTVFDIGNQTPNDICRFRSSIYGIVMILDGLSHSAED